MIRTGIKFSQRLTMIGLSLLFSEFETEVGSIQLRNLICYRKSCTHEACSLIEIKDVLHSYKEKDLSIKKRSSCDLCCDMLTSCK